MGLDNAIVGHGDRTRRGIGQGDQVQGMDQMGGGQRGMGQG